MGEFENALLECQKDSKIPGQYDWFAPLLGDWEFDYYDVKDGKRERHVEGEWLFRRALDGTCIEDLFICPSRATRESNPQPDGEYGAAIRMFQPETKSYDMVYTTRGSMARLKVQREEGKIVCTVLEDSSAKWVFNSDNCHGDTFHYTSPERMEEAIRYWLLEYERKSFVRWSIFCRAIGEVVGTIELFHRDSEDYFTDCGLLRLDLRSDYEKKECIREILKPMLSSAFSCFPVKCWLQRQCRKRGNVQKR